MRVRFFLYLFRSYEHCRPLYSLEVDVHGVYNLLRVAPSHRYGDGDTAFPAGRKDEPVTFAESLLSYRESPQPVAFERVRTGQKDCELPTGAVEGLLQRFR